LTTREQLQRVKVRRCFQTRLSSSGFESWLGHGRTILAMVGTVAKAARRPSTVTQQQARIELGTGQLPARRAKTWLVLERNRNEAPPSYRTSSTTKHVMMVGVSALSRSFESHHRMLFTSLFS
jgi:hypothetical protein